MSAPQLSIFSGSARDQQQPGHQRSNDTTGDAEPRADEHVLLRHLGYHVVEVADGVAAIEAVIEQRPQLILLDISIPKIDGWTVARMLRDAPATAKIPLVALTAHAFQTDRDLAAEIGFDDYLSKPVEPRDVVKCVERLIGGPALSNQG